MKPGELRNVRWTQGAIVFQGALHALNPVQRVGKQIAEPMLLHRTQPSKQAAAHPEWPTCSNRSACPPTGRGPTRTSSPAGSDNGC